MVTLEEPAETRRIVLIEFPSLERAKAFYRSPEYGEVKAPRDAAGDGVVVAVGGHHAGGWSRAVAESEALAPPSPA